MYRQTWKLTLLLAVLVRRLELASAMTSSSSSWSSWKAMRRERFDVVADGIAAKKAVGQSGQA
jgi:hypothetical protein